MKTLGIACIATISIVILVLLLQHTDSNVTVNEAKSVYSIDNGAFYLRRVTIAGDRIYFVVDKDGKVISGTSTSYMLNKTTQNITSVVGDE